MIYRPRFSTELKVIDIFRICGMYWCALFHYLASRYGGVFTTGLNLDSDLGGGGGEYARYWLPACGRDS